MTAFVLEEKNSYIGSKLDNEKTFVLRNKCSISVIYVNKKHILTEKVRYG